MLSRVRHFFEYVSWIPRIDRRIYLRRRLDHGWRHAAMLRWHPRAYRRHQCARKGWQLQHRRALPRRTARGSHGGAVSTCLRPGPAMRAEWDDVQPDCRFLPDVGRRRRVVRHDGQRHCGAVGSALAGAWVLMADNRETPRPVDRQVEDAQPCPFCASTNVGFYEYVYAKSFAVACRVCGGQGPHRSSTDEALKLWNRRVPA